MIVPDTEGLDTLGTRMSFNSPETPEDTTDHYGKLADYSVDSSQVFTLAKESLDFLAALAMPDATEYAHPDTYVALWAMLRELIEKPRDFSKLALGLPRGFAKTTLMKLFILYCILFTSRKFILVISASATLAENIISDVADMLDEQNVKTVFGDWRVGMESDRQDRKTFSFRGRPILLVGVGQGTSIRGIVKKNSRPDVMIFEDIQTREDADSQVISEAMERWMIGTAMKAKSPRGCLYIFVANMYPTRHSLLKKLKHNPSWLKVIAGGILADGSSLWEELQPREQLMLEYKADLDAGHPEIFDAEVLNDENANVNNCVDLSKMPEYPYLGDIPVGKFIIIDPSNDKANSDAVTIALFDLYEGIPAAVEIIDDRLSPGDIVKKSLEMALRTGCSLIVVEANAFQYSLLYWFNLIMEEQSIYGIEVVPIYSGSLAKNTRILTMFKQLIAGEIYIHPAVYPQVSMQITQFNPLRTNNVDGILDCLTYSPRILTEFGQYITVNNPFGSPEFDNAHVMDVSDNCSF